MTRLNWLVAVGAAALVACSGTGGTGGITGTLTVAGAKKADVSVDLLGPVTRGAVTDANGAFAFNGLPDGDFVVRASVPGTREGTRVASVTIKGGKSSASPTLAFTTDTPVTISGHIVFSDGSDATGVVVTAAGPVTQVTTAGAGGAFSFAGVPPGGYVLSADVADTREQHLSVGANAVADLDVGNLTFTPSGRVPGTVTFNGAPASAVQIVVTGTSLVAISGDEGQFEFSSVPTGAQTLLARVGDAPFFRSAMATVTVTRGENAAVALTLTDDPLPTGTVSGKLTFETGANLPSTITIAAAGTSFTTHPSPTGDFSFDLPVGNHRITATAPHYTTQTLGTVTVSRGQTTWLPEKVLSFFVPVFTNTAGNGVFIDEIYYDESASGPPTHTFQLISLCENAIYYPYGEGGEWDCTSYSLRVLNLATAELTPVYFGQVDNPVLSSDGQYAAWVSQDALWVFTIATRTTKSYALPTEDESWRFNFEHFGRTDDNISIGADSYYWSPSGSGVNNGGPGLEFSADGLEVYVARRFYGSAYVNGSYPNVPEMSRVTRVTLASGALVSTPGPQLLADGGVDFGFATGMEYFSSKQWLWQGDSGDGGTELHAFTSGVSSTVFAGTPGGYSSSPVPSQWSTTTDGGAQLSVFAPGAATPVIVQGIEGSVESAGLFGSRRFPIFSGTFSYEDGGSEIRSLLVNSATGESMVFDPATQGYAFNPDESAIAYTTAFTLADGGTGFRGWFQPLPITAPATMFVEREAPFSIVGWLSSSTMYGFVGSLDPAVGGTLLVATNGVLTSAEQSSPGDPFTFVSGTVLQRTSAGWRAFIGDGLQTLSVPTSTLVRPVCAPNWYSGAGPTSAAFEVSDGSDGFMSVNAATGATRSFPLSSMQQCNRVGNDVAGFGTAELHGQSNAAVFFFGSGDTIVWSGGAYEGYDVYPTFVGSEVSLTGLLSITGDHHTLGFGLVK